MIQDVVTVDLTETANALVKLYVGHGRVVEFLDALCAEEIQNTSEIVVLLLKHGSVHHRIINREHCSKGTFGSLCWQ